MYCPDSIKFIFDTLENCGYECFAVGGCVRDSIMGITPKDWDFTTNATPQEISESFSNYKLLTIGSKFGTIGVIADNKTYEITTYRTDGDYLDSRHPDTVCFSSNIEDDLIRRDFTINSMAYNEKSGLIDPFGGRKDLENGVIRCTGHPLTRFEEDAIRIMRALRFSSRFGFDIDKETSKALIQKKESLLAVHPQRLKKELSELIIGKYAYDVLGDYASVISVIIPEVEDAIYCNQNNPHHIHSVWNHTLKAISNTPCDEEIRLCLLFHDLGKPMCKTTDAKGVDHFKGHQSVSASVAEKSLSGFGFSHNLVSRVTDLIRFHDERFKNGDADIKRVLSVLGQELFFKLMTVAKADILGQSDYKREKKLDLISSVEKRAVEIIENKECYSLKTLNITGRDIEKLGFRGKKVGEVLSSILDAVINEMCINDKDVLIGYIKEHFVDKTEIML